MTLSSWPYRVSSDLTLAELLRAARRVSMDLEPRVLNVLSGLALHPVDRRVIMRAARLDPPSLRSLDAIHLATALELGAEIVDVFTYDRRLVDACWRAGLRFQAPGQQT